MTAVTALLALALTGCSSDDERVEENSTVTLDELDVSFVVPVDYVQADEALIRERIAVNIRRFDLLPESTGTKKDTKKDDGKKDDGEKDGGKPVVVVDTTLTAATLTQSLLDSYEAFLVDPVTESSNNPDTVVVRALTAPVTTGSAAALQTGLEANEKFDHVETFDQGTSAGPAVRATYDLTVGKDADGDDVDVFYQVVELGLDDTSSLQFTITSLDEEVARDLADTIVASLATTG